MKIYLVSDGEYSDYRVCGIYSTPERAAYARELFHAENDIKEMDVDALPPHPQGMLTYCVCMDKDGNTSRVLQTCLPAEGHIGRYKWMPTNIGGEQVCFEMWAKDEQHAVMIANERRIILLASGEWTTDYTTWRKQEDAKQKEKTP